MALVRWGIIGTGNIANKFANAIKNVKNAELVAVASRSEETSKKFAEKYNIPYHFSNYEKMASFDKVDAVYIATSHTPLFIKFNIQILFKINKG